ncbi:hypothetical protein J6590_045704 [Homalodisca vitripennis]|nr:hypothetical protein J6590_045704 [Homalodisca vitripennis]
MLDVDRPICYRTTYSRLERKKFMVLYDNLLRTKRSREPVFDSLRTAFSNYVLNQLAIHMASIGKELVQLVTIKFKLTHSTGKRTLANGRENPVTQIRIEVFRKVAEKLWKSVTTVGEGWRNVSLTKDQKQWFPQSRW